MNMSDKKAIREKYYPLYLKEPLQENCIAFESLWGRKYNCNPAALYEYINENHTEYECIWFVNDLDIPVKGNAKKILRGTQEYYYYLATAKYLIYNNNLPQTFRKRDGQVIVQTMHGTPFKSFGLDVRDEVQTREERMKVINRSTLWDYLVAQGSFTKSMVWRWFRYNNTVLETGYPRTDMLYTENGAQTSRQKRDLGIPGDRKVILYAPTWRELDSFEMMLDIDKMREALSNEYVLLIRPHYFVSACYNVPEDGLFVFDASEPERIEDLFGLTDILITDYSSVMFDFSLMNKPMIFYTYDLKEYTKETRGSYFDIATEAPGVLTKTTEEVINAIWNIDRHFEINRDRIERFRRKYLTYENPNSSELIFNKVFIEGTMNEKATTSRRAVYIAKHILPRNLYSKIRRKIIKYLSR